MAGSKVSLKLNWEWIQLIFKKYSNRDAKNEWILSLNYYRQEKKMMVVSYKTKPTFQAGNPEQLFESDHVVSTNSWGRMYDLSSDGKRFLMIKDNYIQPATREIHVVVNWFEEIKEKMAAAEERVARRV